MAFVRWVRQVRDWASAHQTASKERDSKMIWFTPRLTQQPVWVGTRYRDGTEEYTPFGRDVMAGSGRASYSRNNQRVGKDD